MTELHGRSLYIETAKKFGIKLRIWKWGIVFFPKDPYGRTRKLVDFVPLWGWMFNESAIIEAMANDPDMKITYKDKL